MAEQKVPWSPPIYPALVDQLADISRKKGISITRLTNLYLQAAVAHELLMEKETAIKLLESVLIRCIHKGANDVPQQSADHRTNGQEPRD